MSNGAALDAMLRRASRMAEEQFDQPHSDDEVIAFFLFEKSDGKQGVVYTEMIDGRKDEVADIVRGILLKEEAWRYTHVLECWVDTNSTVRPSEDPGRKEILFLYAEDRQGYLAGHREIVRPVGGKPYLGKLEYLSSPEPRLHGRFANLLPPMTAH